MPQEAAFETVEEEGEFAFVEDVGDFGEFTEDVGDFEVFEEQPPKKRPPH